MSNYIYKLPIELQDYIIYYIGLDAAVILNNKYIINKLIRELDLSWEDTLYNYSVDTIRYLIKSRYREIELSDTLKIPPCSTSHYFTHTLLYENNTTKGLHKLNFLASLFKKTNITITSYDMCNKEEYRDWVKTNYPMEFMWYFIKSNCKKDYSCPPFFEVTVKCGCKMCGGNGIGYI